MCVGPQVNLIDEFVLSCFVRFTGLWDGRPFSSCFMECCFQNFFSKKQLASFCSSHLAFYSNRFLKVQVVLPYNITDTATAWKNFCFILSVRSDFLIVDNLSIAFSAYPMHILISLSVDEILLLRYMNRRTSFRGMSFNVEMTPSWLKYLTFVLSGFTKRPILLAVCSRLCNRHSSSAGALGRRYRFIMPLLHNQWTNRFFRFFGFFCLMAYQPILLEEQ